jgi:hypothetical protein
LRGFLAKESKKPSRMLGEKGGAEGRRRGLEIGDFAS